MSWPVRSNSLSSPLRSGRLLSYADLKSSRQLLDRCWPPLTTAGLVIVFVGLLLTSSERILRDRLYSAMAGAKGP